MKRSLLIVEDDSDLTSLLRAVLEDQGYEIETAANGLEALERVEQSLPSLILLDMKMPVMNGWEFARVFREKYDHRAPIVVLTASEEAAQSAKEVEAAAWMGKPFDIDALVALVEHHMPS
jgi:CheY-like chemotaxis protein